MNTTGTENYFIQYALFIEWSSIEIVKKFGFKINNIHFYHLAASLLCILNYVIIIVQTLLQDMPY